MWMAGVSAIRARQSVEAQPLNSSLPSKKINTTMRNTKGHYFEETFKAGSQGLASKKEERSKFIPRSNNLVD
jgi:hypothetical protein